MPNENLEKLVQAARDKKPTTFKQHLHAEIGTRVEAGVTEIRADLAKNMFASQPEITEHCEGAEVEHTHDDGTTHSHDEGGHPHTHGDDGEMIPEGKLPPALQKAIDAKKKKGGDDDEDKEKDEGTLPPALQKAIDAKKKNNSDDDDEDKSPAKKEEKDEDEDEDEDESPVGKADENLANFKGKKAKPFKKEDITDVAKKILAKEASGGKEAYQKFFSGMLKKFGVKSAGELSAEEKKKFYDAVDAGWEGDNESD